MTTKQLTPFEMRLAASLLEEAADEFGNRGCNDLDLENTEEVVAMLNDMEQRNVGPGREPETLHVFDPTKPKIVFYDWWVMRHLAKRLLEASKEQGHG